jgi:hypothetical protein
MYRTLRMLARARPGTFGAQSTRPPTITGNSERLVLPERQSMALKTVRDVSPVLLPAFAALALMGCGTTEISEMPDATPPPETQAWMDRLTVSNEYDPETGFIVARETVDLPPILANAPPLDEAVHAAGERVLVVFATADRCAPCQQYKLDAMNDARVVARLAGPSLLATHVEVDRQPHLADTYLGGRAIPMTYALRGGERIATLRGQRSADDLLAWLDELGVN